MSDAKEYRKLSDLKNWDKNPRSIKEKDFERLKTQIRDLGQYKPLLITADGTVLGGNMRLRAYNALGMDDIWVSVVDAPDEEAKMRYALSDNDRAGFYDEDLLANLTGEYPNFNWEDYAVDMTDPIVISDLFPPEGDDVKGSLEDTFLVPPFSVLDTRQGYWQDRKRKWLVMGIKSEIGRKENLTFEGSGFMKDKIDQAGGGTSTFDPVLCELMYRWFAPTGGHVFDPFAGGSVRGIVAQKCGLGYTGIDLGKAQLEENETQAKDMGVSPTWIYGNSMDCKALAPGTYDFIFSCPPYYDLEQYDSGEGDLSMYKTYEEFYADYSEIIMRSVSMLGEDRFACFVVSEIRDKAGFYRGFVPDTIKAFNRAGMALYNEAILVNSIGSLPLRIGRQFNGYRKMGRTHQNILVFYKGNPKNIKENYGEVEIGDISEEDQKM